MATDKHVSVVVVTHQSQNVIARCLQSIPKDKVQIFVVDNASKDNSCAIIEQHAPQVTLIKNQADMGFGAAANKALKQVNTEYALVLKPEIIINQEAIDALIACAECHPQAAIIAPVIYDEDQCVLPNFRNNLFVEEMANKRECIEPDEEIFPAVVVSDAMLLRLEFIKKLGLFDENLLAYEDDDLCMRCADEDYDLVVTPDSKVTHIPNTPSYALRILLHLHKMHSRLYLEKKYHGDKKAQFMAMKCLYIHALKCAGYMLVFQGKKADEHRAKMTACLQYL